MLGKLILAAAGLGLVVLPANAVAQEYAPSASQPTVEPGGSIRISASGFAPGGSVQVLLYPGPAILATTVSDDGGAVVVTVKIPTTTAQGEHTVKAVGPTADGSTGQYEYPITVTGGSPATPTPPARTTGSSATSAGRLAATDPPPRPSADLAYTGDRTEILAGLGAVLLGAGLVLIKLTRRRRHLLEEWLATQFR